MSTPISTQDCGQGPAVILISGLGGLGAFWQPVIERLSSSYRVITFDHPGVGRSSIEGLPTIPGIVDTVLQVMDNKGLERAHLVGHSTGSLVAQAMALDYPKQVTSIVLSSGWAQPDKRFADFFAYRKYLLAHLGGTAYNVLTRLIAYPSRYYEEHFAVEPALNFDEPSSVDIEMNQARMDMLLNYSRHGELGTICHPVTVIGARDDYIVPFYHSEELARLIRGAALIELSGGHFAPVTRTSVYCALLQSFWESAA
ncbi:alpha/beta fold hydrolase [Pseudomonas sp. NA-150]|uniref:alpha/beta fold hydrolase n=1 Tax=Pseudomonas sp. NA-150 TaxID=3367525 RepID=UPI0037C79346